jgi:hypothetical protein
MSPSLGASAEWTGASEDTFDGRGDSEIVNYIQALQQVYGREARNPSLPLAYPYGVFVTPSDWQSQANMEQVQGQDWAREYVPEEVPFDGNADEAPGYTGTYEIPYAPDISYDGPVGAITGMSWGVAGRSGDGGYAGADVGEASAWASVVTSAVSGPSTSSGTPALALSGEERQVAQGQGGDEAREGQYDERVEEVHLDELADSVYTLIRRKLEVEKERNW